MQSSVVECTDICKDTIVKEKLIKAQQETEDIYIGEEYEYKDLTADERIIVELLSFIMDTEISRVTDADIQIVNDCVEWSLAIQNKKVELSKEFIEEQVNKIFNIANKVKDSEQ